MYSICIPKIVAKIEASWCKVHQPLHHNTVFGIPDRVACCLHYLTHSDGYKSTGALLGISTTRVRVYCRQVIQILVSCHLSSTVCLPKTHHEWATTRNDFEKIAGMSDVYGAIDGSLIRIKRFQNFAGWYCRKGFTAFNMQALVDGRQRFRSYSLRSGSQNDKSLFNHSKLGKTCHKLLPYGGYIVADAGYKLFVHVMTPFAINYGMADDEAHYNLVHSRTRIVVEQTFGRWKNIFRIFKNELDHGTPEEMTSIIEATLVLQDWFIDFTVDDSQIGNMPQTLEYWMHIGGDMVYEHERNLIDGTAAANIRNIVKEYLTLFAT